MGISDLAAWHAQCKSAKFSYYTHLENICGGAPGTPAADAQYRKRSPINLLSAAANLPIAINVGIFDGHMGSVPVSQSLLAFNTLAVANGHPESMFTSYQIRNITKDSVIPCELKNEKPVVQDLQWPVLLRRTAGSAQLSIFQGVMRAIMRVEPNG